MTSSPVSTDPLPGGTLVVTAHPEPRSFTRAWASATAAAARALGPVAESDLHAMRFDPVERAEHYGAAGRFDPLKAQEAAVAAGRLPTDLAVEVDKIQAADLLVLHFPVWWFGPPAILKGWFDRALVHGVLHRVDERFGSGPCRGKRALFCVSTGCTAAECGPDGREGDLRLQLWPLAHALRYCGYTVLEPVTLHEVHGYHEGPAREALAARLADALEAQAEVVAGIARRPVWASNADTDFGPDGRLLSGAPVHSPFIRHATAG